MKKFVCYLMSGIIFFSSILTGCNNINETDSSKPEDIEKVTISFWHAANEADENDRDFNWNTENIEYFTRENLNIKIERTIVGGENYRLKLNAEAASGNLPDIFMTWLMNYLSPMVRVGAVMQLDQIISEDPSLKEIVDPDNLANATFNGKVYALPDALDVEGIFYNKEMFSEYGLKPPQSIDDLIEVSNILKENEIIPIGFGNSVKWLSQIPYMYILADLDPNIIYRLNSGQIDFNEKIYKDAAAILKEVVDADIFIENFNGISPAESRSAFVEGQVAMHIQGSWQAGGLQSEMGDKVGFIPFPTKSGHSEYMIKILVKGYAISSYSKEPEAAIKFLKFMFSKERQIALANRSVFLASKNIPLQVDKMGSLYNDILKQIPNYKQMNLLMDYCPNTTIGLQAQNVVQDVTTGKNIDELFKTLAEFYNNNLQ